MLGFRTGVLGWIETGLWTLGAVAFLVVSYTWGEARSSQQRGAEELRELQREPAMPRPGVREGTLVGRVDIERLGLSAVIFEGTTKETLDRGVGHLTESARPEARGNVVLAGHRDTFFRPLKLARAGDSILLTTPEGERRYEVRSTEVVPATDLTVIQPTSEDMLTMITCYPFTYIGAAPDRFIVHATRIEVGKEFPSR